MFHQHSEHSSSSASRAAAHQEPTQLKHEDELKQSKSIQLKPEEELKQSKSIQLKPEDELKQHKAIQRKPEDELKQTKPKQLRRSGTLQFKLRSGSPIQRQENNTGMPDNLKSGIEHLSGMSMNDVKVHYNSSKPAQFQAHAYAQGTDIHVASGQEKHVPHEAWHVVQQKQGRVQPTTQVNGSAVNDNPSLESEADAMGAKAMQMKVEDEHKV